LGMLASGVGSSALGALRAAASAAARRGPLLFHAPFASPRQRAVSHARIDNCGNESLLKRRGANGRGRRSQVSISDASHHDRAFGAFAAGGSAASITQTRPSGLNSTATLTPVSVGRARCRSLVPKPCRVGGSTGGPPVSVHRSTSRCAADAGAEFELRCAPDVLERATRHAAVEFSGAGAIFHVMSTVPPAFDRLPYLAALVASS
jgi:hypothetical protein